MPCARRQEGGSGRQVYPTPPTTRLSSPSAAHLAVVVVDEECVSHVVWVRQEQEHHVLVCVGGVHGGWVGWAHGWAGARGRARCPARQAPAQPASLGVRMARLLLLGRHAARAAAHRRPPQAPRALTGGADGVAKDEGEAEEEGGEARPRLEHVHVEDDEVAAVLRGRRGRGEGREGRGEGWVVTAGGAPRGGGGGAAAPSSRAGGAAERAAHPTSSNQSSD